MDLLPVMANAARETHEMVYKSLPTRQRLLRALPQQQKAATELLSILEVTKLGEKNVNAA
jgi:hypothetical protein